MSVYITNKTSTGSLSQMILLNLVMALVNDDFALVLIRFVAMFLAIILEMFRYLTFDTENTVWQLPVD